MASKVVTPIPIRPDRVDYVRSEPLTIERVPVEAFRESRAALVAQRPHLREVLDAGPDDVSAKAVEFFGQFVGKPCLPRSVGSIDPHANGTRPASGNSACDLLQKLVAHDEIVGCSAAAPCEESMGPAPNR